MGKEEDHLQSITECPDCASENIVHSTMRDQVICKDCGLVFEPFTPVERPATAAPARKPAKKAKPKARKAKAKKAKPAKKARAKAKPAKKAKKSKSKKKFGWW